MIGTKSLRVLMHKVYYIILTRIAWIQPRALIWVSACVPDQYRMISSILYRIPLEKGVASLCAQTGRVQNVRDAQRCPHFNPDVDTMTGYTTHSLLCAPVIVRGK